MGREVVRPRARSLAPLLSLAVFAAALWVLHREFADLKLHDVVRQLEALPGAALAAAVGLTALSYLVLTAYDSLSLEYLGLRVGYRRTALASFLSYAFSQNVGLTLVSGAPIRFRLYTVWGLSAVDVATVVAFNGVTFWLGLLTVGGIAFATTGSPVPTALHIPLSSLRPLGVLFFVVVVGYLAACLWLGKPLRLGRWELVPPSLRLAGAQVAVSSADWLVSASVLWVLLSPGIDVGFPHFVAVFILAQILGLASQVPGGLGVFETVVISLLPAGTDGSALVGALIAYRVVYYLLPLAIAVGLLFVYELAQRRRQVAVVSKAIGTGLTLVAPPLLAVTTFLGGAVLLVSGATPGETGRLRWLADLVPLAALELSHFLGSVAGVLLLLLAWGLWRRLTSAYYLTLAVLASGVLFSLLKGADYEEALVLTAMIVVLIPSRGVFYRRAPLLSEPLSPNWLAGVAMVLAAAAWIGLFAYRHVGYSTELWWRFALDGDASRFLRAGIGVAVCLLVFGVARLLGPASPRGPAEGSDDGERVRAIVEASPRAAANLALLGDKSFLFSTTGRAMIMYAVSGRSWVAMGDPIGPGEDLPELVWSFHTLCDRHGGWTVFYEVGGDNLTLFLELGLTVLRIGEQGSVPLSDFSLDGREHKKLRYVRNKLEREGCVFEVVEPDAVSALLPRFREVSDAWLADRNAREKGFSLGRFTDEYVRRFPCAVVRQDGTVVAFANIWRGAPGTELSIDLMRSTRDAPGGVMDFLFVNLMEWGREHGFVT
ncbi:MAG: bifunctional lysylphosphatidylglycerol flippase/synthetase MprF, partial [Holophagae bacterium]